eukprot:3169271-Rhodomonas_salina.1
MPLVLRRSCMNLTSNLKLEGTYQCVSCRGDLCQQAHKEDGIALFAKPKFKLKTSICRRKIAPWSGARVAFDDN